MSFRISPSPLEPATLKRSLLDVSAGAFVTFEGWVRNENEGQPVQSLEYEAYPPLAEKEGARILAEARDKFAITGAIGVHRTGLLQLGDVAIWVGVTAAHRQAAFEACRYIIDEAKARLPVWKKEHYAAGTSAWINCAVRGDHAGSGNPPGTG